MLRAKMMVCRQQHDAKVITFHQVHVVPFCAATWVIMQTIYVEQERAEKVDYRAAKVECEASLQCLLESQCLNIEEHAMQLQR